MEKTYLEARGLGFILAIIILVVLFDIALYKSTAEGLDLIWVSQFIGFIVGGVILSIPFIKNIKE